MSYTNSAKNWEGLAQKDPLWAILTDQQKKENKWNIDDFFKSGESEVRFIFELLKEKQWLPTDHEKAMDFGCGVGRTARFLQQYFDTTIGIDVSASMIEKAKQLNEKYSDRLSFIVNTENNLTVLDDNSLSFIFSTIVLQHIPYPASLNFIIEFTRKLKHGGLLVIQIPIKDVRNVSLIQKVKETIKIKERLASLGIGKGFQMSMNPVKENLILDEFKKNNCEVLGSFLTNHTDPDFNGGIQFISEQQSKYYLSKLFIVRKK